ncbi:hypothetical protein V2J09_017359 [Rumex salicifolius]
MAALQSHFLFNPPCFSPTLSSCSRISTLFPKLLFKPPKFTHVSASPSSVPGSVPEAEKAMLEAVVDSQGDNLPCVRSYENDLSRLTIVGSVNYEQALTAAAADGGEAATDHLSSGMDAMVVETIFPGSSDDRSTVSTRLFLPAKKVKEKAKKLRNYITEDILKSANSANILAMTFRQVVMQSLWSFELVTLLPGSRRNMDDLGSIREVPASFALSSSDERVIYVLAEAVCILALEGIEKSFYGGSGKGTKGFLHWASNTKRVRSKDSSVTIYRFEDEVVGNAKSLLEKFNAEKSSCKTLLTEKPISPWWSSSMHSNMERIGGHEFSAWTSEYVPAYKLEIDSSRLTDVTYEGWKKIAENRWEVLLTHSQMVGLANILDMALEDPYTLPDNGISCSMVENPKKLSKTKRGSSLLRILSTAIAGVVLLVSLNVVGRICLPHVYARGRNPGEIHLAPTTDVQPLSLENSEVDAFCITIIRKIKDNYALEGEIVLEPGTGAWIGKLPAYLLGKTQNNDLDGGEDVSVASTLPVLSDEELKLSAQTTISYQVVLSAEGKIVGFQPTSRVAVSNWAANPLAKELYGLLEPGLKINKPNGVIVLELLMSPDFALVRPLQ